MQSDAISICNQTWCSNSWYLFPFISFFQLTDTDAMINKGDENLHALVKELNGNMSAKARFTACYHLIEALFYFPWSNVSFLLYCCFYFIVEWHRCKTRQQDCHSTNFAEWVKFNNVFEGKQIYEFLSVSFSKRAQVRNFVLEISCAFNMDEI